MWVAKKRNMSKLIKELEKMVDEGEERLLDQFAITAMQGILSAQVDARANGGSYTTDGSMPGALNPESLAKESYLIADAMLKEKQRRSVCETEETPNVHESHAESSRHERLKITLYNIEHLDSDRFSADIARSNHIPTSNGFHTGVKKLKYMHNLRTKRIFMVNSIDNSKIPHSIHLGPIPPNSRFNNDIIDLNISSLENRSGDVFYVY